MGIRSATRGGKRVKGHGGRDKCVRNPTWNVKEPNKEKQPRVNERNGHSRAHGSEARRLIYSTGRHPCSHFSGSREEQKSERWRA